MVAYLLAYAVAVRNQDGGARGAHAKASEAANARRGSCNFEDVLSDLPQVFVTRRLPGDALARLSERAQLTVWEGTGAPEPSDLLNGAQDADGLLCLLTDRVDAAFLERCPRLRVISSCSVGVDHIDLVAATARGIPIGHTPGVLAQTTADFSFALLLAAARHVVAADRFVREGGWTWGHRWDPEGFLGVDVYGATLGVVGLGEVGRALATRARGFGMRVLGWSRRRREIEGVERVEFDALIERSDFVTLHVALTPETRGLIDRATVLRMRSGAVLVNASRGGIVDEAAVAASLRSGHLAGAGFDVFRDEPIAPDNPLLAAPNIVLTPHIGSASVSTRARMADLAVENLLAGLDGRPLPHCANGS